MENIPTRSFLILIILLIAISLAYRYYNNKKTVDYCYELALEESVRRNPYTEIPNTTERQYQQQMAGARIFKNCLDINGAQWPEPYSVLGDRK